MKIFFDTEFTGLYQNTKLISIGIIAENNDRFYAEFNDYDKNNVDDWVKNNVIKNLTMNDIDGNNSFYEVNPITLCVKGNSDFIRNQFLTWLRKLDDNIEVWSDCLAYDWVLFNELLNNNLPKYVYYIPFDICTLFKIKGIDPDISREKFCNIEGNKHNSLFDALVIKKCYEKMMNIS